MAEIDRELQILRRLKTLRASSETEATIDEETSLLKEIKSTKGARPKDLSNLEIIKKALTKAGRYNIEALGAIVPGAVNLARGQVKGLLSGETIPHPLALPSIPQRDKEALLGFRFESPLTLGRQALSRATGIQDILGQTVQGLGQDIDISRQQFEQTDPTIAARVGRAAPSAAALFGLRDTKSLAALPFARKAGVFGMIAGGLEPRGEEEGLLENVAIGGVGGLTVGVGLKGLGLAGKGIGAILSKKQREKFLAGRLVAQLGAKGKFDTQQAATNIKRFKAAGIKKPTLSGLSGSPRIAVAESAAKSLDPDVAAVSEGIMRGNILKRITSIVNKFDPKRTSEKEAAGFIFKAIDKGIKNLKKVRGSIFNKGFALARRATGDRKVIDSKNVVAAIDGRISKLEGAAKGEQEIADIKSLIKFKAQLTRFNKLSVEDLQNLLSSTGKAAAGKGQIITDIKTEAARNTKGFIFGELKTLLKGVSSDNRALNTFLKARSSYARITDRIKAFQNTDTGKIIDSKFGLKGNIDKIIKAVNKADPEELRVITPMLKRFNPRAYGAMIRTFWRELSAKSRPDVAGPGKTGTVNVDKLLKNLLSEPQKTRFTSVFSKGDRREIVAFAKGYRDLINRAKGNEEFISKARDIGGFAGGVFPKGASLGQMPIFIMRFLAKGMTEKAFVKLMLSESGKKAVIQASKARPTSPQWVRLVGAIGKEMGIVGKQQTKKQEKK